MTMLFRIISAVFYVFLWGTPSRYLTDWPDILMDVYRWGSVIMIVLSLMKIRRVRTSRKLTNIMVSLTSIPFVGFFVGIMMNLSEYTQAGAMGFVGAGIYLLFPALLPISLMLERKNRHNQGVESMVKKVVDEMEAQRTKTHP